MKAKNDGRALDAGQMASAESLSEAGFTGESPVAVPGLVDELLKLENQLCFPLYACSREVVRRYTPFLDKLGLTYTQYLAMMALWEYGDSSVGELCARLYLDTGTMTPLLKKLEAKGYVKRVRSEMDARKVDVSLTEKGTALKAEAAVVPINVGTCLSIEPDDAVELKRLLEKVLKDNVGA